MPKQKQKGHKICQPEHYQCPLGCGPSPPDIPAGGGTTDAAQADIAAPQAQDRESETPEDSNDSGNDDEATPSQQMSRQET